MSIELLATVLAVVADLISILDWLERRTKRSVRRRSKRSGRRR